MSWSSGEEEKSTEHNRDDDSAKKNKVTCILNSVKERHEWQVY